MCQVAKTSSSKPFKLTVTQSNDTLDGLDSGDFTATVSPSDVNASSYSWSWSVHNPQGQSVGNNPSVSFTAPTSKTTRVVNAHWYAMPDDRILAEPTSLYDIKVSAVVNGVTVSTTTPVPWGVRIPDDGGRTTSHLIVGDPTISTKLIGGVTWWAVTGIGTLRRTVPQTFYNLPSTSQFFKIDKHEARHREQFTTGVPGLTLNTLWNADAFYNDYLSHLVSPTELDLLVAIDARKKDQNKKDNETASNEQSAAESDAYVVSNKIPPFYFYER